MGETGGETLLVRGGCATRRKLFPTSSSLAPDGDNVRGTDFSLKWFPSTEFSKGLSWRELDG